MVRIGNFAPFKNSSKPRVARDDINTLILVAFGSVSVSCPLDSERIASVTSSHVPGLSLLDFQRMNLCPGWAGMLRENRPS